MAQSNPDTVLIIEAATKIAGFFGAVLTFVSIAVTFIAGKRKRDTGEQRRAVVNLADVVAAQNETIDEKNREIDELMEANSAAQVRINDLRAKLDSCDCE